MSLADNLNFFKGHKHLGGILESDQLRLMVLAYFLWGIGTSLVGSICCPCFSGINNCSCGLQRFHRRLKDCVQIFIPLHDKITKHWFLLVMKLKEKTAELWDSVPELTSLNRRIEIARATMLLLQTVFSNAMTKSSDMYYNFPSFRLSFPEGNPTTDIKYDSGIFVMMQMKCYSDKWFEGYNSEVMRSALALEIVNNQSNELLKSVIAAAMKGKGFEEGSYTETTQANAVVTAEVVATEWDTATGIIHEKPPNGWKCRSHRKRKFRV